jgi:tetratricopeptide (TPR) repeat protein
LMLSKVHQSWGSFFYEPDHDLLRTKIQLRENAFTEMLTYDFINSSKNSSELVLNWEKKQFPVKIEFDVDGIVMANAQEQLKNVQGFTAQGFLSAANYSLQNKANLEQGLKWADQAVTMNRNFPAMTVKANILRAMDRGGEADALMTEAMNVANEGELNQYGYQLLGNGQTDKAIEVFVLNTKRFPKSANCFDSLGEAYVTKGDNKNAIANFKKSLSMNPPPNVKTNSEKHLKDLGAM